MHDSTKAVSVVSLCLALALAGCGGDRFHGTWTDPNGTITLPDSVGGGSLADNATLTFDGNVQPQTFDLKMLLSTQGLSDTLEAKGTYTDTGAALTLTFTGFVIDPASGNTASVASDGSQCLVMMGLGGAGVCFSTPQSNGYTMKNDALTVSIDNAIVGASPSTTTLSLTKAK